MRVAVISDIHANLAALESVLVEIDREGPDEVWCLGDVVGYGPRPNECCDVTRDRSDLCLAGNHDLAVLGVLDVDEFSPDAAVAARWTAEVLGDDERGWLGRLKPAASREGAELFHASARDPVWEYVLTGEAAWATLELTAAPVVLVGHSHIALSISLADEELAGGAAPAGTTLELDEARWILNPGSVGQPRDGDPRAAWLLLDLERGSAAFRRVPYAVQTTQRELRAARLPETLAARLAHGH
jgi:diadenosine tetraphosphatase ApaH/serine/threonine PP2A family protein phosphatase